MWVNTRFINSTRGTSSEDLPLVEFMYLVFTCMPGESYHRWLSSLLLCLCDVFWVLINSLVCWFCMSALGLILFQICVQAELLFHETAWNMGNETLHLLCTVGTLLVQILKFRLGYKATDPFHRPSFGITFTQTNSLPGVLYKRPCFLVPAGPCCCQVTDRY